MGLLKSVKVEDRPSSSSTQDHENEEGINWGALEKLPTLKRAKHGFLHGVAGEFMEVDLTKLGVHERRALLNRLVRNMNQNEVFLHKVKARLER